ncbi:MAG: Spy/CpxP family protein refolding chaperone [Bdellovibrionales bacterium]|nr:Spy/CpxP family protein refolding chaperone [Bdellovibrionales bacterium]
MWYKRRGLKVAAMAVALIGAGSLVACHRSPEDRVEHISKRIASKLDFNDQQKALLSDITNEIKNDLREMKTYRESRFNEVEELLNATTLDKARIKARIKEQQEFREAKVDKYLDKVAALHATLSAEQKKEMLEKIQKLKAHWL